MNHLLRIGISAALLIAATSAFSQEATLKRTPKAGESTKYRVVADLDFSGISAKFSALSIEKITAVDPNGNFTIESTSQDVRIEAGGAEIPPPDDPPTLIVYSPAGDIVEIRGERVQGTQRISNLSAFRAPEKAVKAGDTWTREIKADAKSGAVAARATYTVEGAEKVGEFDTYRIKYTYTEIGSTPVATADGHFWVNIKDGTLVKSVMDVKNAPFPEAPFPVNAKITVTRVE